MVNPDHYLRQLDIVHPQILTMPIAIIGAGGIGSWTALALTKLGCQNVMVLDHDVVEPQNIGCQMYNQLNLGTSKVESLAANLNLVNNIPIFTAQNEITNDNAKGLLDKFDIVVSAVDDIDVRRTIFNSLKGTKVIYIDGRMAADALQVFTTLMDDEKSVAFYEDSLFPASEAEELPCTAQAVVYNCFVVAGIIGSLVAKVVQKQTIPREVVIDLKNYALMQEGVES